MWGVYTKKTNKNQTPNSGLEEFIVLQVVLICNQNKCRLINAINTDVYLGKGMDEN